MLRGIIAVGLVVLLSWGADPADAKPGKGKGKGKGHDRGAAFSTSASASSRFSSTFPRGNAWGLRRNLGLDNVVGAPTDRTDRTDRTRRRDRSDRWDGSDRSDRWDRRDRDRRDRAPFTDGEIIQRAGRDWQWDADASTWRLLP